MNIQEAMKARHSVRSYTEKPLDEQAVAALNEAIAQANEESGLNMQLVCDEPKAFTTGMAHFGKFSGVRNYLALVGPAGRGLNEAAGYYGERIVLEAARLGIDSCWVALTFGKGQVKRLVAPGQKLACVVSLGYGETHGSAHNSKPAEELCRCEGAMPDWFVHGMDAAMLAPTAMNQQKFRITCTGPTTARIEDLGGSYSGIDLGIVRYHFEQGAGAGSFTWDDAK